MRCIVSRTEQKHRIDTLYWDINSLFENVVKGIRFALKKYPLIKSLAIDTWGVDYVLLSNDVVITPCLAYRDNRTAEVIDKLHKTISFEELYDRTGIQFQLFNTIYQFYEDNRRGRLDMATDFLMISR